MSRRYSPSPLKDFSPLLHRLVRAAEAECPPGHAEALVVFITLALRKTPPREIFDSGSSRKCELSAAIQSIAKAHFEVDEALAAWRRALKATNAASRGVDDVKSASPRAQSESDSSYFYAGLAFGLVFAGPCTTVR